MERRVLHIVFSLTMSPFSEPWVVSQTNLEAFSIATYTSTVDESIWGWPRSADKVDLFRSSSDLTLPASRSLYMGAFMTSWLHHFFDDVATLWVRRRWRKE